MGTEPDKITKKEAVIETSCNAGEIRSIALLIHGEKAHSCYFSKDTYAMLKGDNKELMIIPNAFHTDLYDKMDVIPLVRWRSFFTNSCKER